VYADPFKLAAQGAVVDDVILGEFLVDGGDIAWHAEIQARAPGDQGAAVNRCYASIPIAMTGARMVTLCGMSRGAAVAELVWQPCAVAAA
jgi:hypothetical protein